MAYVQPSNILPLTSREMAAKGKTIIATIHQPSSQVNPVDYFYLVKSKSFHNKFKHVNVIDTVGVCLV